MADAEKEKAEKVAAARKRYEELKKKKAKKDKKKDEKGGEVKAEESVTGTTDDGEPTGGEDEKDAVVEDDKEEASASLEHGEEKVQAEKNNGEAEKNVSSSTAADLSLASRMRSESFRRGSNTPSTPLRSPGISSVEISDAAMAGDATHEVYKKQATRIEGLEAEVKRLYTELEARTRSLQRVEGELEEFRDAHADVAELRHRAEQGDKYKDDLEKLKLEVTSLKRQNEQIQTQKRRTSSVSISHKAANGGNDDLTAQLTAKANTIDSLTLDLSNTRHEANARITALEASLAAAESASKAAEAERDAARMQAGTSKQPSTDEVISTEETPASSDATENLDLAAALSAAAAAAARATALEKKIEALTALHRDTDSRNSTQLAARTKDADRARQEAADLRARLREMSNENARIRGRASNNAYESAADLGEMDEVDLNERGFLDAREAANLLGRGAEQAYGALSNVFSAFSGGGGAPADPGRRRSSARATGRPSLDVGTDDGLQDFDEDEFDESAFRAAQEDEARKRLERVRDAKRKLEDWRGWRVDMVEVRGGVQAGVFDV